MTSILLLHIISIKGGVGTIMFKKIITIVLGIFSLFGMIYGETIDIGDLTISHSHNETTKSFTLHKIENQKYILKFQHYGIKTKNITIYLYLNNNHIFTIDDGNSHRNNIKPYPNITLDVSSIVVDGNNNISLKLANGNLGGGSWGYKINDAILVSSSTAKAPIPTPALLVSILAITAIILKNKNNK
jgi:hypothetical protein